MKILVISALAADCGSAVRARNIAENLTKTGCQIEFIKPFAKSLPLKFDIFLTIFYYLYYSFFIKYDIFFAVKTYPNVGIPAFFQKILGKRVVFDTDDLSFEYSKGFWRILSKFSQELFLPLADLHTYHNLKLYDYLIGEIGIMKDKTYCLPQGVDLEIFGRKLETEEIDHIRATIIPRKADKILLFVGHFDVACDLANIFKAFSLVTKKNNRAKLVLVGSGAREAEFKKLAEVMKIENDLLWLGNLPPKGVANLIAASDVCLVYYQDKKANRFRSSLKLREYLAMGKKVVCNNVGELNDFKKYTYQTNSNVVEYAGMIKKVLTGFGDNREKKGRTFVNRHFSWQKISSDFILKLKNL